MNNIKQPLNNKRNTYIENSKNDKSLGSTTYSKNKKNLDKMLREYQSFCKKYFGESTPIGSMTEERMNKLLEDEENINNQNKVKKLLDNNDNNTQYFDIFNDNNENFNINLENKDIFEQLPDDIIYSENSRLGNNKNNKNDYKRRFNNLFNIDKNNEKKNEDTHNNKEDKKDDGNNKIDNNKAEKEKKEEKEDDEYNDFEDENMEEIKNKKAGIIQKFYKRKKIKAKNRIYFGYDRNKKNILWIYADKLELNNNLEKIRIKCYSIEQKKEIFFSKTIKDLLNIDYIPKDKIKEKLDELIDKIEKILEKDDKKNCNNLNELNKNNNKLNDNSGEEEKVLDEDGNEYVF